jgi:pyridoxamine 5'-phosphate oxidase
MFIRSLTLRPTSIRLLNSPPHRNMASHIYSSTAAPQPPATSPPGPSATDSPAASTSKVSITSHNQYNSPHLVRSDLNADPLQQFKKWFQDALSPPADSGIPPVREPEAMAITSVSSAGIPSTRFVLLKTVDDTGFVFFTNYESRKSKELASGYASMAMYWKEVSRQVRVVGKVEKVKKEESAEYFATRPRGSQVGAWASPQSKNVEEGELEQRVKDVEKKFESGEVECPEHWGGWRIVPL